MESVELRTIIPILQNLSTGELETLSKHINRMRDERVEQRRKELWGNVIAAMHKYCNETGEDIITDEGYLISIDKGYEDTPGILYTRH